MTKDPVIASLSDANPVPPTALPAAEERAEADRVLRRVMSAPPAAGRFGSPRVRVLGDLLALAAAVGVVAVVAAAFLVIGHHRPISKGAGSAAIPRGVTRQRAIEAAQLRRQLGLDNRLGLRANQTVAAHVIGRNPTQWYATLELDKGSQGGVRLNDPVIGDGALVGRITTVDPTVSIVTLITDPSFAVSAEIRDSAGDTGVLVPAVRNPNLLLLEYVPRHAALQIGQQVVTVGFTSGSLDSLYPAGIPIGQVASANENELINHGQVKVTPTADLRHLDVVQILTDPRARLKQPSTGSTYCVNSTTGKRTPCSPRTPSSPVGNGFLDPFSPHPGSPIKLVAQLSLPAPSGAKRPAAIGRVVEQGDTFGVTIVGVGLPGNTKRNAYAVWLTNGPRESKLLGFVNPAVKKNGTLKTAGILPKHAFRYHQLLITLETQAGPKTPGAVVLEGSLHR